MAIDSQQQGLSIWEWSVNGQVEGQIEAETYTVEYQGDCTDFSSLPGKNLLTYASRGFYTFNFSRWATPPHSLGTITYVDLELEKLVISSEDQEIYYYPTGGQVYRSKVYYHLFREGCTVETVEGDTGANNGIIYKPKNPQFGGLWRLDFFTEGNRIARYEYQQRPTVEQLAGEGYYCPLLEDECITVKHVIEEELNNAREVRLRRSILNDLPITEAAYANLDPETYYESPNLHDEEVFVYDNITSIEVTNTRPDGYCQQPQWAIVTNRIGNVRYRSRRTFYDFDITIEGYDYDRPQTQGEYPDYYLDWLPPTPRHTVRISGKVLEIERYRTYTTQSDGTKDYSFRPSDYIRFLYTDEEGFTCNFTALSISAPYLNNPDYFCYYFAAKDLTITWHSSINPYEETYNFYSEDTLVATHLIKQDDYFSYSDSLTQPRQETVYKINKADYLPGVFTKQLQLTDEAYNFVPRTLDPINPCLEIPRHCWNIYMVAYPLPTPFLLITTAQVEFVMQICTDDPGTFKRPQLEITCGCGESCPDGTCPVECTDHVCCYGSDGVSLKEIPLVNYDG